MTVCDYYGNCHDFTVLLLAAVFTATLLLISIIMKARQRPAESVSPAPDMEQIAIQLDRIEQLAADPRGRGEPSAPSEPPALAAAPVDPRAGQIVNFLNLFNGPNVVRMKEGIAVVFDVMGLFSSQKPPQRAELFLDDIFPDVRVIPGPDVERKYVAGSHHVAVCVPGSDPGIYRDLTTCLPRETIRVETRDGIVLIWRLAERYPVAIVEHLRTAIANAFGAVPVRWVPVFGADPRISVQALNLHNVYGIAQIERGLHQKIVSLAEELAAAGAQEAEAAGTGTLADGIAREDGARPSPFRFAADVHAASTRWLWPNVIPLGAMTLLGGQPKRGKSQIAIAIAAQVSSGGTWPTGEQCQPGSVILMECEDPASRTRARIEAAGGNVSRIVIRDVTDGALNLAGEDMALLEQQAAHLGNVRLVVVSPLLSHFGKAGATDDATVRARLAPLLTWAARNQVAVIGITHPPKGGNDLFAGADGFRRAARAAFVAELDPADSTGRARLFKCVALTDAEGDFCMRYRIEGAALPSGVSTSRVRWLGLANSVQDAGEPESSGDGPHGPQGSGGRIHSAPARQDDWTAAEWLKLVLADGPQSRNDLISEAMSHGWGATTVDDAKRQLGVIGERQGNVSLWRLPA
jgi:putative DNA primase/helicase